MEGSIPVIAGCTATGKTACALELAEAYSSIEIVSADSRQFYRGMDIGTAKPSRSELDRVPHHMIDIAEPDRLLSAGWFREQAMKVIEDILSRGGIPLVVGGTALYIMHLAGLSDPLPERNEILREALKQVEEEIPGSLHRLLNALDPQEGGKIHETDSVRLVRSLEIALLSGERPSCLKTGGMADSRFRFAVIEVDNTLLRERIAKRTRAMIEKGLVEEVRGLLERGVPEMPVLGATIGYAEILDHIAGKTGLQEASDRIFANTWKYARRQRNMLRRLPGAVRIPGTAEAAAEALFGERISNGQGQRS